MGELLSIVRYLRLYWRYLRLGRLRDAHHLARLARSEYFDADWYVERNHDVAEAGHDPVLHYVDFGAAEKRNPSELFDTKYYVAKNAEALSDGLNPLLHFLRHGRRLGRQPRSRRKLRPSMVRSGKHGDQASLTSRYSSESLNRKPSARYVIYSVVIGGYDDLKPPAFPVPNCDFVLFSDQPLKVAHWKVLPLNYLHREPARAARFVKLHPHLYFPDYTHSIWLDANIGVRGDIGALLDALGDDGFMAAFEHPLRDCVYEEGAECIERRKDHEDVIVRHLHRYREKGVPEGIGLWETNVLVRRHNDPACIEMMSRWWQEIQMGSRRDQLALPVVQRELEATIVPLDAPGICARAHPLLTFSPHLGKRYASDWNAAWPRHASSDTPSQAPMTIGICVHNGLDVVRECLASVVAACREEDSIVIVDDASDPPTASFLDLFAATQDRVRLIRNTENLGYTKSANRVFKATTTDWIILLNSDTVVPRGTFRKLVDAGERYPRLAIVGPLSNAAGWQTVPRLTGDDGTFLVNRLRPRITPEIMDGMCEDVAHTVPMFVPLVNGFCIAIRRTVLEEIGFFDEQHFPLGYGEEDDLCLRAADAGYVCGVATNTYVFHRKSASFTPERRKVLSPAGQAMLMAKYGAERLSALTEYMRRHPGLRNMRVKLRSVERSKSRLLARTQPRLALSSGQSIAPSDVLIAESSPGPITGQAGPSGMSMVWIPSGAGYLNGRSA